MMEPSIEAVIEFLRLGEPPTVWRALVYAIGIYILAIPIDAFWIKFRYLGIHELSVTSFSRWLSRLASPSILLHRLFPTAISHPRANRQLAYLDDLWGHWDVYGLITADAIAEELLFRGLPMGVALWLGYSPVFPVVCGTLIWVAMHHISAVPPTLLSGILYAWLWISGAWWIAIIIHVGGNCLLHTLKRWQHWSRYGRYPDPMPE